MSTSGNTTSDNSRGPWVKRREHDSGFAHWARLGLAISGVGAFVFSGFAMARDASPELGATALIVVGAILLILALIGKMPLRFSAGGFELEFSKDTLKEILAVVQSEAPDIFETVADIASGGTRTKAEVSNVISAARADNQDNSRFEAELFTEREPGRGPEQGATSLSRFPEFKVNPAVDNIPGRGRPPQIDAAFTFGGTRIAVEAKKNWTRSTSALVRQRLARVLTSPDFGAAVLIVPASVFREAQSEVSDSRIVVTSEDRLDTLERDLLAALSSD